MNYNYQKKAPLSPAEWNLYGVDPVVNFVPPVLDFTQTTVQVPIVGAKFHDIQPFDLSRNGKPVILGEPTNQYDSTALLVVHSSMDEETIRSVGHIGKVNKWLFAALHPDTWRDPGFAVAYQPGAWFFDIHLPAEWLSGFHAWSNHNLDPADRGGNIKTVERNWWLCGFLAAKAHDAFLS